jgi:DNA processing protein
MPLSDQERIGLSLLPTRQQHQLREYFVTTGTLQGSLLDDICKAFEARISRDMKYCQDHGIILLSRMDDGYPSLLCEIPDFPLMLYVQGHVDCLLENTCVGIVGTRHATPYGLETARSFAHDLAGQGVIIVSGLAQGIDGAAHSGAIETGRTIAVIGTGIDQCFPVDHRSLMKTIAQHGCVISEFPLKTHGAKMTFPARNRIIAGLSRGVLVVESQAHGGSLITARLALEYNREVFALPGRINDPTSQGTLKLIRDGAALVRNVDDILSELRWVRTGNPFHSHQPKDLSVDEALVFRHLSSQSTSLDDLSERVGLSTGALLSILSQLELKGLLRTEPGGCFRKTNS